MRNTRKRIPPDATELCDHDVVKLAFSLLFAVSWPTKPEVCARYDSGGRYARPVVDSPPSLLSRTVRNLLFGHPRDSTRNITFSVEVAQKMRQLQPVIWSKGTFLSPQPAPPD